MGTRAIGAIRLGVLGVLGAVALAQFACSPYLPRPPYVAHPREALATVPFPPPPARVEYVPSSPRDDAVWVDGQWLWTGREWAWVYGAWVVPPEGARYSPWGSTRNSIGKLYYAPGTWRRPDGRAIAQVPIVARGRASEEDVIEEEGELVETGPNIPPIPKSPN